MRAPSAGFDARSGARSMNASDVTGALSSTTFLGSTTLFRPAASPADAILDYSFFVIAIVVAIGLLVGGLIFYTVIRFRHRPGDDGREPPQIYGSNQLELAWTVVPVIVVFIGSRWSRCARFWVAVAAQPDGLDARHRRRTPVVVGVRVPEYGFKTANELHVPVGKATFLNLQSADVIHSFWVPQLSGKTDVIPNRRTTCGSSPMRPGSTSASAPSTAEPSTPTCCCASSCTNPTTSSAGWRDAGARSHGGARAWRRGRRIFESTACINCHTVRGTVANGRFGPDLTHLMSRATIASGARENEASTSRRLDREPGSHQAGRPDAGDEPRGAEHPPRRSSTFTPSIEPASTSRRTPDSRSFRRSLPVSEGIRSSLPAESRKWLGGSLHDWATTVDHKRLGILYIGSGILFLVIGGLEATAMRPQLVFAENELIGRRRLQSAASPCTAPRWCSSSACRSSTASATISSR